MKAPSLKHCCGNTRIGVALQMKPTFGTSASKCIMVVGISSPVMKKLLLFLVS